MTFIMTTTSVFLLTLLKWVTVNTFRSELRLHALDVQFLYSGWRREYLDESWIWLFHTPRYFGKNLRKL